MAPAPAPAEGLSGRLWGWGLATPTGVEQKENTGFGNRYAMAAYEAQMKQDIGSLVQSGYVQDFLGSLDLTA